MVARQDDGGQPGNVSRLVETVRQLCGAIESLTTTNSRERESRIHAEEAMSAAEAARIAAEDVLEHQYHRNSRLESRLAEWEVPPVCNCGRNGYEVWCRCGKQLK